MNNLEIYVEGYKIDIDDVDLTMNYVFSNLENPFTITTDFSKTFTIKGTQNNNKVFGQIWDLNRQIVSSIDKNVDVYFNASKKALCKIVIDSQVFKSGYIKLNTITINKGKWEYSVTFYSDIGNMLHTLSEKSIVDLNWYRGLEHTLNRTTINSFFNDNHSLSRDMTYIMANNGIYDDFDANKQLTIDSSGNYLVEDVLGEIKFDECAKGEYRSYKQRPALKIAPMFEKICEWYNDNNANTILLDDSFFRINNPYYNDSVMTLPLISSEEFHSEIVNTAEVIQEGKDVSVSYYSSATPPQGGVHNFYYHYDVSFNIPYNNNEYFTGENINFPLITSQTQVNVEFEIGLNAIINNDDYSKVKIGDKITRPGGGINGATLCNIECYLVDSNNNIVEQLQPYSEYDTKIQLNYGVVNYKNNGNATIQCNFINPYTNYKNGSWITSYPVHFFSKYEGRGTDLKVQVKLSMFTIKNLKNESTSVGDNFVSVGVSKYRCFISPITKAPEGATNLNNYYPASGIDYNNVFTGRDIVINTNNKVGSNVTIDKTYLINNELKCSDFLINYCKTFGLMFDIEEDGYISIKTKNEFFKNYKILDWEDKIDYSKAITQTPITFSTRFLKLANKDNETYYENYYLNKVGKNYGSQIVNTGYEFNEETTDVIPNNIIEQTVMSRETTRMLVNGRYINTTDEKLLPAYFKMENNERNASDTNYSFLFYNGSVNTSKPYYITDDISEMFDDEIGGGKSCWIDTNKITTRVTKTNYPQYSTLTTDGKCSWDFGYPTENYAGWTNIDYPSSSTIYSSFWSSYISEIYNVNNKIIKCYMKLGIDDMMNFSFKNFIKAFGCLWHINKINGYSPLSSKPTEVELIKVDNISAYTNGQKTFPEYFNVTYNLTGIRSSNTFTKARIYSSYQTYLTPTDITQVVGSRSVTMGGVDITSTVYSDEFDEVNIPSVTGDIVITASVRT